MMEYERLTVRLSNGKICTCTDIKNIDLSKRLAELEDKIEQGTLIELLCKVGDTVYRITQAYRENEKITTFVVKEIIIDKKGVSYLTLALKGAQTIVSKAKVDSIFLTREEAEKRLKELQNGKN